MKKYSLKNYSLSIQIWIIFAIITLSITLIISVVFPTTLRGFFTSEIYSTIESAQDLLLNKITIDYFYNDSNISDTKLEDIRTVKHFLIYSDNQIILDAPVNFDFLNQVKKDIALQTEVKQRYRNTFNEEKLFYVISQSQGLTRDSYLVSYMSDSYRNDLVKDLFSKLISIMLVIIVFSWVPALYLSKYLSKPLVDLEHRVKALAKQDWKESINLNRNDEIGKLGDSVEKLRVQLIRQDEAERTFLQNISHELKTPVMVIRSFSQAIRDGIFPKGDLDNSVEVIDEEGKRLEKKIRNLVYFSKLDYMSNYGIQYEEFSLDDLVRDVIERLSWTRKEIDWLVNLEPILIKGDREQWVVVIENLIDNQIRYAHSQILVNLYSKDEKKLLEIGNDGPPIEDHILKSLFLEYKKGQKGEFGLGLAIVGRILKLHQASIEAKNLDQGVVFTIVINE